MMWIPLRSMKMKRFIFGSQRRGRWPQGTPDPRGRFFGRAANPGLPFFLPSPLFAPAAAPKGKFTVGGRPGNPLGVPLPLADTGSFSGQIPAYFRLAEVRMALPGHFGPQYLEGARRPLGPR